jgi:hypothetical protein
MRYIITHLCFPMSSTAPSVPATAPSSTPFQEHIKTAAGPEVVYQYMDGMSVHKMIGQMALFYMLELPSTEAEEKDLKDVETLQDLFQELIAPRHNAIGHLMRYHNLQPGV